MSAKTRRREERGKGSRVQSGPFWGGVRGREELGRYVVMDSMRVSRVARVWVRVGRCGWGECG